MFNRSKNTNKYHNYIIVSEKDTGAKQVQFSQQKLLTIASLAIIVLSLVLFLSVDALTNFLYKNKINDLKDSWYDKTTWHLYFWLHVILNKEEIFPQLKILSVANMLGEAIWRIHEESSVSSMFR